MRRKILIFALGGLTLLICCGLIGLFFEGYYLPFKPCRPITYPDGTRTGKHSSYTSTVSLDTVLSFYDQHLDVQPWPADTGQWRREKLEGSKYLYSCYAGDINGLTTETGCIYVSGEKERSHIETVLFRSEGGNIPCPRK
jgi:hypothetical protein